eukprot:1618458-Rhodomonas_salina.1
MSGTHIAHDDNRPPADPLRPEGYCRCPGLCLPVLSCASLALFSSFFTLPTSIFLSLFALASTRTCTHMHTARTHADGGSARCRALSHKHTHGACGVQDPAYPVYVDSSVIFGRSGACDATTKQCAPPPSFPSSLPPSIPPILSTHANSLPPILRRSNPQHTRQVRGDHVHAVHA